MSSWARTLKDALGLLPSSWRLELGKKTSITGSPSARMGAEIHKQNRLLDYAGLYFGRVVENNPNPDRVGSHSSSSRSKIVSKTSPCTEGDEGRANKNILKRDTDLVCWAEKVLKETCE